MPQMLKPAVTDALIELLEPIQQEYSASKDWQDTTSLAYPPPDVKKKEKKPKNLGTRFPGAMKDVEAKADGHVEGKTVDQVNLGASAEEAVAKLAIKSNENS